MFKNHYEKSELYEAYALSDRQKTRVRVNFISSADGAVTLNGRSGELGTKTDQSLMKVLRAMSDVVMVGAGTVRSEGYGSLGLKDDDLAWRKERELPTEPRFAIVTNSADLDPEAPVFRKAKKPPIVITNSRANADHLAAVSDIIIAGKSEVEAPLVINKLTELGLKQILCEGGPHLFGSMLDADLVDEVCLTISPNFVGGDAGRIVASEVEKGRAFKLGSVLQDADSMLYLRYQKQG